ncbi:uncharacterized protein LOC125040090 [Penaeus chinensis]|uniref:uncharacterized protein LOC125040090 n=1 Tax=Penaeus chinensis TaxID=139456 RepID=UPI001FB80E35|nr:uncharacterized protein LOC125040090 [Penaeus chinensis]XP_047490540.1 uncharacterized protein LOC125040090 [Penaeus chinensis]
MEDKDSENTAGPYLEGPGEARTSQTIKKEEENTPGLDRNPSGTFKQTSLVNFFREKRTTGREVTVKEKKKREALDTARSVKTPSQKTKKKGETSTGKRNVKDGKRKESNGRKNRNAGERKRKDGERTRKRKQKSQADKGRDPSFSLSIVEQNEVLSRDEGEDTTGEHPVGSGRRENQQPEDGEEGDTQPNDKSVPVGVQGEYIPVILGLETTDRVHRKADILQIAATPWLENSDHGAEFNVYTFPREEINWHAAKRNGFSVKRASLFQYGKEVAAVSLEEGLRKFIEWLRSLGATKKLLLCHNAQRFCSPILERHVAAEGLRHEFEVVVIGFCDTLEVFRELDPERRTSRDSFRLEDLIRDCLGDKTERHDCEVSVHHQARLLSFYKAEKAIRKNSFYVGYSPWLDIK